MQRMGVSWLAQLGNFLQKHVLSLGREEILPRDFKKKKKKSDKIYFQSPRAKLGIGKLGSLVLTDRHKQRHYRALAQIAKNI